VDLHRRLTAAALPATLLFPAATAILAAGPRVAAVSPPGASTAHADAYYLYCLFQQSLMQRDYGRALSYLEEASRSDPNAPELAVELGRAYLNMDELDRAETEARRAEALAPALIDGKRLLVDVYKQYVSHTDEVDEGLFTRAAAAYVDLVSADPTDRDTRLGLARLYLGHGLFKQAGEILKAQVAADPESLEAAYLLGETLLRTGDKDEAKKVLADAAGRHPENPDLQRALADSLEASGDLDGALKILNAIVVANPDRPGFRFQLARLFLAMKRYDDAADEANRLLQALEARAADSDREGDQRSAYMLLIEARVAGGKLDDAVAAAQRAEKDFPQETRFTLKRAEILLTMGRDGEAEAIVKSVGSKPGAGDDARAGISEVYFRAGAALERSGDYKKAVALLRQSIESDSGNHAALNYLGYMMADRGDNLEESLDLIQRALRLDDGNGAYLDSLGWTLFRLKRYDQAERPLEQAAKAIQDEPVVHDHLGDLYWAVGRSDDAVRAWREALRLGIEDKDAIQSKIDRATPSKPASP
jgi:tetratricopeptide (TPR) repeat protein